MNSNLLSRRKLFQTGAAAAAAAGVAALPGASLVRPGQENDSASVFLEADAARFQVSMQNAYVFLDTMMDAYAQGSTMRLSQSYSDEIGLESTAFVYDNAVEIMARFASPSRTRFDACPDPGKR